MDYKAIIRNHVLDEAVFVEAIFSARAGDTLLSWQRVTIRPVMIRHERYQQFSYFDGRQIAVQNYQGEEMTAALDDLLAAGLKSIQVKTTTETVRVQFSRRGRPIIHRQTHPQTLSLNLTHDRSKQRLLADNEAIPFLQAIGVQTADGRVRADKQRKFRQINEFLRLIDETGVANQFVANQFVANQFVANQFVANQLINQFDQRPLQVVDLGCGSAALTFATYHYFNHLADLPAEVVGVDVNRQLIERHAAIALELGWERIEFVTSAIRDYRPQRPPDVVLALHACDTATDEALAQAIRWQSTLILSSPCCHHHLQAQLDATLVPEPFQPVMRHGILKERLGDILTDSFRALILRIKGYQTDVVEFIDVEHTPRNLMIRATRTHPPGSNSHLQEYAALKAFWNVTPYLETLLGNLGSP
jgi:2-polyprenyl-3-methyl-5-hydroxy-6-metoxy-1,4-benzoquinol methylase